MPDQDHASTFPGNLWSCYPAKWDMWHTERFLELWQAACLACDVDPSNFDPYGFPSEAGLDALNKPVPGAVNDLLELTKGAVGSGFLALENSGNTGLLHRTVSMQTFAGWLGSIKHPIPSGFPWKAGNLTPGNLQWPWGNHQTKELLLLALAADRFWKNFNPLDPSTAPTNNQVIDWLIQSEGATEVAAKRIATMLRPETLPTGRRKSE